MSEAAALGACCFSGEQGGVNRRAPATKQPETCRSKGLSNRSKGAVLSVVRHFRSSRLKRVVPKGYPIDQKEQS